MPNQVDQMLSQMMANNPLDMRANKLHDHMFLIWNDNKPERYGLHASSILDTFSGKAEFCYRQHALAKYYIPAEERIAPDQLRVFLEGWYIHLKWQMLYKLAGYAVEIENTRKDPIWEVYHTPDAIVKIPEMHATDLWIVEIKSMGADAYDAVINEQDPRKAHPKAFQQCQLYMYFTGIRRGITLLERKGGYSPHRELCYEYDPEFIAPYIHRLNILTQLYEKYENGNEIKRIDACVSKETPRAKRCPMKNVCFLTRDQRESFRRKQGQGANDQQINSSLFLNQ